MRQSDQINELATALSKAQAVMTGATKDSLNPHFKSKYADLASVWDACRKPLTDHGLSVTQTAGTTENGLVRVTTLLMHASGQWVADDLILKPTKDDPQGFGSCITYGRRFSLSAITGVAQEDDDGNAASAKTEARADATPPKGYIQWLDDLSAVAENGTDALQAMWKASKPEFRSWLTGTNNTGWEALKQLAATKKAA
jgi:hypothetical protein